MIHQKLGARKRKQENYLFQGLTNTYTHWTKIMSTLLIVALGKAENFTTVIGVNMFGTIGMEQTSLSMDNHIYRSCDMICAFCNLMIGLNQKLIADNDDCRSQSDLHDNPSNLSPTSGQFLYFEFSDFL